MVEYKSLRENSTRIIERDRQAGRQAGSQADRDRQTDTDRHRQTDRQTNERDKHIEYIET